MGFNDREKSRVGQGVAANMFSKSEPAPAITPGAGRPKADRETKKRVSLAILPSIYDDVQKIAYVERKSVSEITEELYKQYVAEKADKLWEYDKIKSE